MYSFSSILIDAQRARWSLEEVAQRIGGIDFHRRFLPDSLVHVDELTFLGPDERRMLNQIRAHSYLRLFALVERFILPFAVMHAGDALHRSHEELLALMQFGEEEAKHIALFERFSAAFEISFGCSCEIVGPSDQIAASVLAEDPLAVALLILHIEWMTQEHYLQGAKEAAEVDESFVHLLRCHWVEEAQHARIDSLLIERSARALSEAERERAVGSYVTLVEMFAQAFKSQVELDMEAFCRAGGGLSDPERDVFRERQVRAYEDAFLGAGLRHPRVRAAAERHLGGNAERLRALTQRYSLPSTRGAAGSSKP